MAAQSSFVSARHFPTPDISIPSLPIPPHPSGLPLYSNSPVFGIRQAPPPGIPTTPENKPSANGTAMSPTENIGSAKEGKHAGDGNESHPSLLHGPRPLQHAPHALESEKVEVRLHQEYSSGYPERALVANPAGYAHPTLRISAQSKAEKAFQNS